MPTIIGRSSISTQLRALLIIIAVVCIFGALFPDSDLIPFHRLLQRSRAVQEATQATRWLFLSGACLCAVAFAAWDWICQLIDLGLRSITRLSHRAFWSLAWGLTLGL